MLAWALLDAAPVPQSPRLSQLTSGDSAAVETFWHDVDTSGTPLLESIPGKPDRVLMTFLWRAQDARDTLNVGVVGVNEHTYLNWRVTSRGADFADRERS